MRFYSLPLWIKHSAIWVKPDKSVWCGDHVQVRLASVVDVRVRFPNFPQHFDTQSKIVLTRKCQPTVDPGLPKVTVHRVGLEQARLFNLSLQTNLGDTLCLRHIFSTVVSHQNDNFSLKWELPTCCHPHSSILLFFEEMTEQSRQLSF